MDSFFTIGIFLSLFMMFLLISKKEKPLPDIVLAIWMLVIGLHLLSYSIYHWGNWTKYFHLISFGNFVPLLDGPLLYLYVVSSLRVNQKIKWFDYFHFLPFAFFYLYMRIYSSEREILLNHSEANGYSVFMMVCLFSFITSGIAYPLVAYLYLLRYKDRLVAERSVLWLKYCILGMFAVFSVVALTYFFGGIFNLMSLETADLISYSLAIFFILYLGYFGIRYNSVFSENEDAVASENDLEDKYRKSGLREEDAIRYYQHLLMIMGEEKPYLESKLTLNMLAEKTNIPAAYLSQVINQKEGKNFHDFINFYRVEEFKELTKNKKNRNLNILAIAMDAGFNSKSTFNDAFKKQTGQTPSQYLREN